MVAATSARKSSVNWIVSTGKREGAEEALATTVVAAVRDAVMLASWAEATEITTEMAAAKNENFLITTQG